MECPLRELIPWVAVHCRLQCWCQWALSRVGQEISIRLPSKIKMCHRLIELIVKCDARPTAERPAPIFQMNQGRRYHHHQVNASISA
jgi:hypothetical protein